MSKNYNNRVVSCTLPEDEKSQLKWLAKMEGLTMSQIVRWILIEYLNTHNIAREVLKYALSIAEEQYKRIQMQIYQAKRFTELVWGYVLIAKNNIVQKRENISNDNAFRKFCNHIISYISLIVSIPCLQPD